MAQPLFFLPDLREEAAKDVGLRRQVLKERGLSEVFADVPMVEQPLWELPGRGPDNLPGCLMYYQTPTGGIPRRAEYRPSEQSWTPVGDGSLLWIGVDTAELPKPEELARKRQYPGYWVRLADGAEWRVPVIRRPDGTTELPTDMVWDATGRLVEPIKPMYQSFWDDTAEVAEWFDKGIDPLRSRALELAIRALSINYRYDRAIHSVVRAIDSESLLAILAATVDFSQKKTDLAQNAEPGSLESSLDTDQAAAT